MSDKPKMYESDDWPRFDTFVDGMGIVDTVLLEQVQELERGFAQAQLEACTLCTRAKNKQIDALSKAHAKKLYAIYGLLLEMQKNPGVNMALIDAAKNEVRKEITCERN